MSLKIKFLQRYVSSNYLYQLKFKMMSSIRSGNSRCIVPSKAFMRICPTSLPIATLDSVAMRGSLGQP